MTDIPVHLTPEHRDILHASAISDAVIEAARIESVRDRKQLLAWGFKRYQLQKIPLPAMGFPCFGVTTDEPRYYRIRPDEPIDPKRKYIQPAGVSVSLYVPPTCQQMLSDPSIPIFWVEGEKKALALASQNVCAVSISGVSCWRGTNDKGGKMVLPDFDQIALNDRRSYVCFDSDTCHKPDVVLQLNRFVGWLAGVRKANVLTIIPHALPSGKKCGVDDFLTQVGTLQDLLALATSELPDFRKIKQEQERIQRDPNGPPIIETNGTRLMEMTAKTMEAVCKANAKKPLLFMRSGRIVDVATDEHGMAIIREVGFNELRHYLERCADFVSTSEKRGVVPVLPPTSVCFDILAKPELYDLPALRSIVTAPTFTLNGLLCEVPGYHENTRMFYHPVSGFDMPDTNPTATNVENALSLICDDLLIDFPFADDASLAHAIGLMLQPLVRPMIDGPTPLHCIDAPAAGTGKGKLGTVLMLPFLGRKIEARTAPGKAEEWDKTLLTILASGPPVVLFDNARRIDSATLDLVLTAPDTYTGRILGSTEERTFPVRQVWITTANNLVVGGDLGRRIVWIRLDAGVEKPEERASFKHANLERWVQDNRGRLVGACVTLIRAWIDAGKPLYVKRRKGSYESWCEVIGGVLQHHGIKGFLDNTDEARDHLDARPAAWRAFFEAWYKSRKEVDTGVSDIQALAIDCLAEEIGDKEGRALSTKIGGLLKSQIGRVFGEYRLEKSKQVHRAAQYRLKPIKLCEPHEPGEPFEAKAIEFPKKQCNSQCRNNVETKSNGAEKVHQVREVHTVADIAPIDEYEEISV